VSPKPGALASTWTQCQGWQCPGSSFGCAPYLGLAEHRLCHFQRVVHPIPGRRIELQFRGRWGRQGGGHAPQPALQCLCGHPDGELLRCVTACANWSGCVRVPGGRSGPPNGSLGGTSRRHRDARLPPSCRSRRCARQAESGWHTWLCSQVRYCGFGCGMCASTACNCSCSAQTTQRTRCRVGRTRSSCAATTPNWS
jgi:hypothetical protein